jgi:hypothetical protein
VRDVLGFDATKQSLKNSRDDVIEFCGEHRELDENVSVEMQLSNLHHLKWCQ